MHGQELQRKQAPFVIHWDPGDGRDPRTWRADSKIAATARIAAVCSYDLTRDFATDVEEKSAMEFVVRPDGTQDAWNKMLVRTYVVRSLQEV